MARAIGKRREKENVAIVGIQTTENKDSMDKDSMDKNSKEKERDTRENATTAAFKGIQHHIATQIPKGKTTETIRDLEKDTRTRENARHQD